MRPGRFIPATSWSVTTTKQCNCESSSKQCSTRTSQPAATHSSCWRAGNNSTSFLTLAVCQTQRRTDTGISRPMNGRANLKAACGTFITTCLKNTMASSSRSRAPFSLIVLLSIPYIIMNCPQKRTVLSFSLTTTCRQTFAHEALVFFKNKWWRDEAASGAKEARDQFISDMWNYPNAVWAPAGNSNKHSKTWKITFHSLESLVWEAVQRLPYVHGGDDVNFGDLYGRLP